MTNDECSGGATSNKANKKTNKFLIAIFRSECRMPNAKCRMPNAVSFISLHLFFSFL